MRLPTLLPTFLALATSTAGYAQIAADSGQRVRVTYGANSQDLNSIRVEKKYAIGVLASMTNERLTVNDSAKRLQYVIPRTQVTLVERSLGKHRNFWPRFLTTFAVSSLAVGAVSAMSYQPCVPESWLDCLFEPGSSGEAFGWGLAGGALLGLPLGLIVGRATTERWAPITLSTGNASRFSLAPFAGAGIGVRGQLRFR